MVMVLAPDKRAKQAAAARAAHDEDGEDAGPQANGGAPAEAAGAGPEATPPPGEEGR
jgi:hypothetical protein